MKLRHYSQGGESKEQCSSSPGSSRSVAFRTIRAGDDGFDNRGDGFGPRDDGDSTDIDPWHDNGAYRCIYGIPPDGTPKSGRKEGAVRIDN